MAHFSGKLAYITGGSSGIGLETAQLLASQGCDLVLFARGREQLERARRLALARRADASQQAHCFSMDVSDRDDVKAKITLARQEAGEPDILIISAGVASGDYFENITGETFDRTMKTNVYGAWNAVAETLPLMKEKGSGNIVILSSMAGLVGMFGYTLYGTTKFALVGLAECLRSELRRYNIAVTVVCPPEVKTPLILDEEKTLPPQGRAVKNLAGLLMPDEVARAVVRAIQRKKFLVIPGKAARFLHLCHRLSNGLLTRAPSDWIGAFSAWRAGRNA
jgi:NAD(P)-dependent dehydrogenase (short-subunit alcohol dehydrogenase family)